MPTCRYCGVKIELVPADIWDSSDRIWFSISPTGSRSLYCPTDGEPTKSSQHHQPKPDELLLEEYSRERKTEMTVENLIESHRNLINELNEGNRKKSLEEIQAIRDNVEKMAIKDGYIKIETLRTMTLGDLADKIADIE